MVIVHDAHLFIIAQLDGISGGRLKRQSSPKHDSIENWLEGHTEFENDKKTVNHQKKSLHVTILDCRNARTFLHTQRIIRSDP